MRYRSNNILAYIPPTKVGELVLKQTMFFQKALGMRVFIFNIPENPSVFQKLFLPRKIFHQQRDALKKQEKFIENALQKELPNELSLRVKMGDVKSVLLSQSKKGGYEFMIIDRSGADKRLSQNDANRIISHSDCPVLTLHKDFELRHVNTIVIPVDISQTTQKKLLWATYFAKKFNAKIRIVSALSMNISTSKSLAWKNAEHLKIMLNERGVDCEVEIIKAQRQEKHKVIVDFLKQEKPGMVIIRTHQQSNLAGTQIGSFVSGIVHCCKLPVFTVNRKLNPMPVDFEL
ncbi:MAG: universal stress protein [Tangfeifania sp.]